MNHIHLFLLRSMLIGLLGISVHTYGQNNALDFDGNNDQVVVPNDPTLNPGTGSFTLEFWLNSTTVPALNSFLLNKYGREFTGNKHYTNHLLY
ncbi:MAG: hypothetical protein AAF740_11990, partial [Bacteroidota bacterium]